MIYSPPEHPINTLQQTKPLTHEQDGGTLQILYKNNHNDYVSLCNLQK